jgi:phage terminase small subunit
MAAKKLTPKQKAFVNEYVIDKNATQAAIRAGYSKKTAKEIGYEHLTKPHIRQAVDKKLERLAKKSEITAEWIIEQFKAAAVDAKISSQHSAWIKAIENLAKHINFYEQDNKSAAVTYNIINYADSLQVPAKKLPATTPKST